MSEQQRWKYELYRADEEEPFHSDYPPAEVIGIFVGVALDDERVARIEITRLPGRVARDDPR